MLHQEHKSLGQRLRFLQIMLVTCALVVASRLLVIQGLQRDDILSAVKPPANMERPARGHITDSHGHPLAIDILRWQVEANPQNFDSQEARAQAAMCLHELLDLPAEDILKQLEQDSSRAVIHPDVPLAVADVINGRPEEKQATCQWPLTEQVWATPHRERFYPQEQMAAHLLGLVNAKGQGYGVEEYYSDFLEGKVSTRLSQQEPPLAEDFSLYLPSQAGHDLILTIDLAIQYIVERALADAVQRTGAEGGTIIIIAPHTGAILAMASYPAYNPNKYPQYPKDLWGIFSDPAISKTYEPGSVFKIITIAAALDSGAITPESVFDDPGQLEVGGWTFRNADRKAHGRVSVTDILALSLNVGVAQVGEVMGEEAFYKYVMRFGLGHKTGVDLAHEVDGSVRLPNSPNWSPTDLIANTFGQAINVTPLQMVTAIAAVANDGLLMQPRVVQSLVEEGRVKEIEPIPVAQVIRPETAHMVTEMLVTAVERGAPKALVDGYRVAGKTGTAQIPVGNAYHEKWTIASFAGFAPADAPAFVCLIKLDKPQTSPWGASVAAPVFREIAPQILWKLGIPPDAARQN